MRCWGNPICADIGDSGFEVIDSLTCNAMATGQIYLEAINANVVLFQELRIDGSRLLAAQGTAARTKWVRFARETFSLRQRISGAVREPPNET